MLMKNLKNFSGNKLSRSDLSITIEKKFVFSELCPFKQVWAYLKSKFLKVWNNG